ncbi:MAG TPA: hypothetical protein VFH48_14000 [Chloroflexota bacterium]|nr:hypothetical protein [Chloroflexota bacterium]
MNRVAFGSADLASVQRSSGPTISESARTTTIGPGTPTWREISTKRATLAPLNAK